MSVVISVEDVSKYYKLGIIGRATLRDDVHRWWARLRGKPDPLVKIGQSIRGNVHGDSLWALREVNFQVRHGEVLGLIGQNGAGKSTLLKILTRITAPTSGQIKMKGRVASLLEVGTGFHPELTGRENVYLNGAILGMTKAEVDRKFDEIVAFSGVEEFIDTPTKRYSSGMHVRLGFAVAAHLEPEILLVDEVLAVGDAEFQRKCLGRMSKVAGEGRTVVFVSHNMTAVRNLCPRSIWLNRGRIAREGETVEIVEEYLRESGGKGVMSDLEAAIRALPPDPAFRLKGVAVVQNGEHSTIVLNGYRIDIEVSYEVLQPVKGLRIYFDILDEEQDILVRSFHDDLASSVPIVEAGTYISKAAIPANFLGARNYGIRICAGIYNVRSCIGEGLVIPIYVENNGILNGAYPQDKLRSKLRPNIPWDTVRTHAEISGGEVVI